MKESWSIIERSYPSFLLLYDVRFHTNSSVLHILTVFAILYLFILPRVLQQRLPRIRGTADADGSGGTSAPDEPVFR